MQNINFLTNGFELILTNNEKYFIAYQAIVKIKDVEISVNYNKDNYNLLYNYHIGENVSKYAYFQIDLINGEKLIITLDSSCKYFRTIDKNIVGCKYLIMLLFGKLKNGIDDEARKWIKNKSIDMYDAVSELKEIRTKLINKFNSWKNNE